MEKNKGQTDKEVAEFESALLHSIDQASRGEGRISKPEKILVRYVGRPKGSVKPV